MREATTLRKAQQGLGGSKGARSRSKRKLRESGSPSRGRVRRRKKEKAIFCHSMFFSLKLLDDYIRRREEGRGEGGKDKGVRKEGERFRSSKYKKGDIAIKRVSDLSRLSPL